MPSSYCATRAPIVFAFDPFNEYELFTIPVEWIEFPGVVKGFVAGVSPSLILKFDPSTVNFVKSPIIIVFIINIKCYEI
jgi:hypothetical protein